MNDNGVGQDDEDDDTDADDEDADVADEEVVNAHDDDGNNTDNHYYHNYNNGKHSDDSSISDKKGPGAATAKAVRAPKTRGVQRPRSTSARGRCSCSCGPSMARWPSSTWTKARRWPVCRHRSSSEWACPLTTNDSRTQAPRSSPRHYWGQVGSGMRRP